jgi:hypothetical protein
MLRQLRAFDLFELNAELICEVGCIVAPSCAPVNIKASEIAGAPATR